MGKRWDITPHTKYIKDGLKSGQSIRMMAGTLGIDHSTLSKAMRAYGITVPSRQEAATRTWKNHRHPNLGKRGKNSYMYGKKLSEETKKKIKAAISGPNNYHWSGGKKRHSGGYILAYAPDHPNADKGGFVLEHRLVYEAHLGRQLEPWEVIHHINEDKSDNRIENLQLLSMAEHASIHMAQRQEGKHVS